MNYNTTLLLRLYQDGVVPCTPNHLQGTAVFCFNAISIDSIGVSISEELIGTKVMKFLEQLISWVASEINCADDSN